MVAKRAARVAAEKKVYKVGVMSKRTLTALLLDLRYFETRSKGKEGNNKEGRIN